MPRLLSHYKWYIRARAYKLLRRLPSPRALEYCNRYMELCVIHTLSRDDSAHEEREQGLKYIRWTMRFDEELWLLGPHVLKALMSVAEQVDDRMRNICLETLSEVLVIAPERLQYANGIRTLVQASLDGPWSISIAISSTLSHMFDRPETRQYAHAGITLGGIISALTEPLGKDQMLAERAKVAAFMLTQFLKSWSGIQYFLSDQRKDLAALVESLSLADSNCKIILGMLLELFGLSDEFDTIQFQQQPRFDVELLSPFHLPTYTITQTAARTRLFPIDYMRTLLLMVFIDEGLVEALVSVALDLQQPDIADASSTLLKWLAQHPHMPLPEKHVTRFQTLPKLINSALSEGSTRSLGAKRVICKIEGIPSLSMGQLPSQRMDSWASSLASSSRSRSRNSIVMTNNNASVEESLLNSLIKESRVTLDDNAMRWNWDVIRSIILGPMSQSRRLPEEVSISGFLTRLSRFFHPASLEFCDLSRTTGNEEYLEIGRHLIHILISSADGLLLIDESRLLPGIVDEVLKQNSYARRKSREESCFSFARLQMTMSPGYFHFLSEIDSSIGGDSLLERARLFDAYYQVVELSDQVLLIQYILASMSYANEGHARNILRKVASSSQESLRLLVPSFLLYLASDSHCRPGSISAWAIEVLLDLIYDSSPVVRSAAAQCLVLVIDLATENPQLGKSESEARIAYLLDLQPMFDLAVVTDIRPLVLRIIATESGYTYLKEQGIVDSEMEAWGALEGIFYVQSIELDVARALAYGPLFSSSSDGSMMMTTSSQTPSTPAHLFGELTKSTGGREFLQEFEIPRLLFETLANIPWDSALPTDITGLKATLWAIGAIGASRDGYLMLQSYNVIDKIIEVMHQTTSLSLKGTCLYGLALISRNMFAAEVFREKGWLLCSSCYGNYEFAVPKRLETVFNADGWASKGLLDGTSVLSEESMKEPDVTEDLDSVQKEIIEAVIRMSNHVMVNTASKTLMRLRTSHPHYFRLMPLYCKAIHLLGKYRYRLSTRRFIYDVFDVNLASLHEEMIEVAVAAAMSDQEHEHELSQQMRGALSADAGGVSRRFSSSSQHFLQTDSATQRKRASTLQGLTSSVFTRRLTNGLIDNIRPARTGTHTAGAGTTRMPPTPAAPNDNSASNMVV
ncbi:hypothetical protein COEREDRAFT_49909 [Coemansia reversa NRRL 1564]|uniref:ARM repeat-containing protein n=1 Tax=Coemansia reversa (strain ATCC 12441 / NRRL 1564) TaxID=763665 RepID=A0A2G5B266_COERN|nr:hypothetical protein COEREDRAFT_49909 [Coemansia reversa NRRL 1564]|eukprot:PIA13096.1 hypothetical protein COEREDRAFT_49909 [Coemansia reversa NRRL 1564]